MSDGSRRPVDYHLAASRYDKGRSLGKAVLDAWWSVIAPQLPPALDAPVVADIGAGTGIFAEEWIERGAACVVALEPSGAMRIEAGRRGRDLERLHIVGGRAEQVPLATASVDVAWMSTVVHHLTDVVAAAAEVRRVLRSDGRLFVRGYFPDRSIVTWLDVFPGADRARARFPTADLTIARFEEAGLRCFGATEVVDTETHEYRAVADWVELMRDADSLLVALTDDEVTAGLDTLRREPERRLEPGSLTLLSFGRAG